MDSFYKWIELECGKVLYIDMASNNLSELEYKIDVLYPIIASQNHDSLITITNVEGGQFNKAMIRVLKKFSYHNNPFIKQTVIIGLTRVQKLIFDVIRQLTHRKNVTYKKNKEEAIDFLNTLK